MDCLTCRSLIGLLADVPLATEIKDSVELHCLSCAECSLELHTQRTMKQFLQRNKPYNNVIASDAFRSRCLRRLYARFPLIDTTVPVLSTKEQYILPIHLEES